MAENSINYLKDLELPQLTEVSTINLLVCNLFYRLKRKISNEQLQEILVGSGIVSYFFYEDSINYLVETGSLKQSIVNDRAILELTVQGVECGHNLRNHISKIYRDKAELMARIYFSRERLEEQLQIGYTKSGDDYYLNIKFLDKPNNLMDLSFRVPNEKQAKKFMEKVKRNPTEFYGKILSAFDTIDLKEEIILTDEE